MIGMASLFENIPNLGNYVRNTVPTTGGISTQTLLYILLGGLLIFTVVLMLMNKKIDFSMLDPRPKGMQITQSANLFWKPSAMHTNLTIPTKAITLFDDAIYTLNYDMVIYNSRVFNKTDGPWRHILHRGSNELEATTVIGNIMGGGCIASNAGSKLPPFGLPRRMNPGIFLDPNINDIIIFVDTVQGSESYRESVRIVDVPLDIPLRLGVTINGRVLEVYLNCKLEVTKVLSGIPKKVENKWYGLSGAAAAQAQIQNMYIWTSALTANDMGILCKSLGPVKFDEKRAVCDAAESVTPSAGTSTAPASSTQKIEYGNSLKSCPT